MRLVYRSTRYDDVMRIIKPLFFILLIVAFSVDGFLHGFFRGLGNDRHGLLVPDSGALTPDLAGSKKIPVSGLAFEVGGGGQFYCLPSSTGPLYHDRISVSLCQANHNSSFLFPFVRLSRSPPQQA